MYYFEKAQLIAQQAEVAKPVAPEPKLPLEQVSTYFKLQLSLYSLLLSLETQRAST